MHEAGERRLTRNLVHEDVSYSPLLGSHVTSREPLIFADTWLLPSVEDASLPIMGARSFTGDDRGPVNELAGAHGVLVFARS